MVVEAVKTELLSPPPFGIFMIYVFHGLVLGLYYQESCWCLTFMLKVCSVSLSLMYSHQWIDSAQLLNMHVHNYNWLINQAVSLGNDSKFPLQFISFTATIIETNIGHSLLIKVKFLTSMMVLHDGTTWWYLSSVVQTCFSSNFPMTSISLSPHPK